jgi:hypothetical protein
MLGTGPVNKEENKSNFKGVIEVFDTNKTI